MTPTSGAARRGSRAFAVAAIAVAGFLVSLTPWSERADHSLLDAQWRLLRKLEVRATPDEVIVVGVDEVSLAALPEPPPLWHASIGRALTRVSQARPRAVVFNLPLPDRTFENVKPGLDRALFAGLADAIGASPFVATLEIDPATRSARRIHPPFLALLGEKRLGLGLAAVDGDGVARRFSLLVPTEDGGFPTLTGRLCRALEKRCSEGLIDYGLGDPVLAVPLRNLLAMQDDAMVQRLFRDRIVLFGVTQGFGGDRLAVPFDLSAWEPGGEDSPAVVVHAQAIRTALAHAPAEASRPLQLLLASLCALLFLARRWPHAWVWAAVIGVVAFAVSTALLRAGHFVPLGAAFATLVLAAGAKTGVGVRARTRDSSDITQPG